MGRSRLVAGNWKMHGSRQANRALLEGLIGAVPQVQGVGCAVCVPFPYLGEVAGQLKGTSIAWGAQNVSEHAQGAYTGEVSAAMLADLGCRYVLVGHSERRQLYGETDAQAAAKFAAAQGAGVDVHGEGDVERSGAGLLYDRAPGDFGAVAGSLLGDEPLRKMLGERGRVYVEARYRWPGITRQYLDFVEQVFGGGAA